MRDIVRFRRSAAPNVRFVADARSTRFVDYAALEAACEVWARELDARRVPAGARVLVDIDDPLAFAVVHLAVIAAGRCSAPVDPGAPPAEAERCAAALRPALVLTDRADRPGLLVTDGQPRRGPRPSRVGPGRSGPAADHVFASPLSRTALTAAALFPSVVVTLDVRLRERGMGEWEGRPKDELLVSHNGWIRTAQYLAGETTLADFHAHPVPQLVPTPLAVPTWSRATA